MTRDPTFEQSETPSFIGRVIAALAADPKVKAKSGGAWFVADLADEYGVTDLDGRVPRYWGTLETWLDRKMQQGPLEGQAHWMGMARYAMVHPSLAHRDLAARLAANLKLEGLSGPLQPITP